MGKKLKSFSRAEIFDIASKYAYLPNAISTDSFCLHYHISYTLLFRLLKKAIVESVISDAIVDELKEKLKNDSFYQNAGFSFLYFKNQIGKYETKRTSFHFSKKQTRFYAKDYVASPLSMKEYAKANYMTQELLLETLQRANKKHFIEESTVIALKLKEFRFTSKEDMALSPHKKMKPKSKNLKSIARFFYETP